MVQSINQSSNSSIAFSLPFDSAGFLPSATSQLCPDPSSQIQQRKRGVRQQEIKFRELGSQSPCIWASLCPSLTVWPWEVIGAL